MTNNFVLFNTTIKYKKTLLDKTLLKKIIFKKYAYN